VREGRRGRFIAQSHDALAAKEDEEVSMMGWSKQSPSKHDLSMSSLDIEQSWRARDSLRDNWSSRRSDDKSKKSQSHGKVAPSWGFEPSQISEF